MIRFAFIKGKHMQSFLTVCKTSLASMKRVVSPLAKRGQLGIWLAARPCSSRPDASHELKRRQASELGGKF
jgi:hypothetical protein